MNFGYLRVFTAIDNLFFDMMQVSKIVFLLIFKGQRRVLAFDVPSAGEIQFFNPVLRAYHQRNPKDIIFLLHNDKTFEECKKTFPELFACCAHVRRRALNQRLESIFDLFITTEQYSREMQGVYSICIFHGQPAKGLTFTNKILLSFDAFFLYGPLQKQTLKEYVEENSIDFPSSLEVFEIGYPKSDAVLNGTYCRERVLKELKLDPRKRTILYAPAFNEGASLRESGPEIVRLLSKNKDHNVIVKLAIDCWAPTTNSYKTGGVNWFEVISKIEHEYPNLRLCREYCIDKFLACSDVLITCVSSVSFEFLALKKPVIIIDTPKFYSDYLQRRFPEKNTQEWVSRTTVNGGREFALVVQKINELPAAIAEILSNPDIYPKQKEKIISFLLYNPGKATLVAVEKIEDLLQKKVKSKRVRVHETHFSIFTNFLRNLVGRYAPQIVKGVNLVFRKTGYRLTKVGEAYIDAKSTIAAAKESGLSICEYLERKEFDKRKVGRRDRIVARMAEMGLFTVCDTVLEIGAGTGQYLEKVIERARPARYEVYETAGDWARYLKKQYGNSDRYSLFIPAADGFTLKHTDAGTCDLVHAHAVFVYTPLLVTLDYIQEASRVLRTGKHLVFDCYLDASFNLRAVDSWRQSRWRFPVVMPKELLLQFTEVHSLKLIGEFREIYGASYVDYLIFRKVLRDA